MYVSQHCMLVWVCMHGTVVPSWRKPDYFCELIPCMSLNAISICMRAIVCEIVHLRRKLGSLSCDAQYRIGYFCAVSVL